MAHHVFGFLRSYFTILCLSILPPLPLVLIPSDPVSVPNASAYMVSVGDVTNDVSKAQITFDVTRSVDNSIVIYGVEAFNMRAVYYNGIKEIPTLKVKLKSDDVLLHGVIFCLYTTP